MRFYPFAIAVFFLLIPLRYAEAQSLSCQPEDKTCLFLLLENAASTIEKMQWQDSTYREMAKLLAKEKRFDDALVLIGRISSPDTKAMTIRGIGMAAAETGMTDEEVVALFKALHKQAAMIEHPPSHAIALTYIAMAQAFAGDDAGAMATARSMENPALRNKAFAESAEIQAERGDYEAASASIAAIGDAAFKDKAFRTISKIFANRDQYEAALKSAESIENAYQKAQAVLYILVRQISPAEVSIE